MIPSEKTLQIGRLKKRCWLSWGIYRLLGTSSRIHFGYIYMYIHTYAHTHNMYIYIYYTYIFVHIYNIINMYCLYTCIHDNPFQFGLSDVQIHVHVVSSLVFPLSMANDVNDTATLGPPRRPGNRHKNLHVVYYYMISLQSQTNHFTFALWISISMFIWHISHPHTYLVLMI